MGNIAVRYQLDRTVVIGQLFGGNIIRVVSVYRAVDANDALDVTCYRPQVMRHHDDSHAVIERGQYFVQFLFKFVIDKIGRFVQNEQFPGRKSVPDRVGLFAFRRRISLRWVFRRAVQCLPWPSVCRHFFRSSEEIRENKPFARLQTAVYHLRD